MTFSKNIFLFLFQFFLYIFLENKSLSLDFMMNFGFIKKNFPFLYVHAIKFMKKIHFTVKITQKILVSVSNEENST